MSQGSQVNAQSLPGTITSASLSISCASSTCNEGEQATFTLSISSDGQVIIKTISIYAQVGSSTYPLLSSSLNIYTDATGETTITIPTALYIPMRYSERQKLLSDSSAVINVSFFAEIKYDDLSGQSRTVKTQPYQTQVTIYQVCPTTIGALASSLSGTSMSSIGYQLLLPIALKGALALSAFGVRPTCLALAYTSALAQSQPWWQTALQFLNPLVATSAVATTAVTNPLAKLLFDQAPTSISTVYDSMQDYASLRASLISQDIAFKQNVRSTILPTLISMDQDLASKLNTVIVQITSGIYAEQLMNAITNYASDLFVRSVYTELGYKSLSGLAPTQSVINHEGNAIISIGQRAGASLDLLVSIINDINSDVQQLTNLAISGETPYAQQLQSIISTASQMDNLRLQLANLNLIGTNSIDSYPQAPTIPLTPNSAGIQGVAPAVVQATTAVAMSASSSSQPCCGLPACQGCTQFGAPGQVMIYGLNNVENLLNYTSPTVSNNNITWQSNPTIYGGYYLVTTLDWATQVLLPAGIKPFGQYAVGIIPWAELLIVIGYADTIPPYFENLNQAQIWVGVDIEVTFYGNVPPQDEIWSCNAKYGVFGCGGELLDLFYTLTGWTYIGNNTWRTTFVKQISTCCYQNAYAVFKIPFYFLCPGRGVNYWFTATFKPWVQVVNLTNVQVESSGPYAGTAIYNYSTQPPQAVKIYGSPFTFTPPSSGTAYGLCWNGPRAVWPACTSAGCFEAGVNNQPPLVDTFMKLAEQYIVGQFSPYTSQLNNALINQFATYVLPLEQITQYVYPHPVFSSSSLCASTGCVATAQASPGQTLNYNMTVSDLANLGVCGMPQSWVSQQQSLLSVNRYFRVCLAQAPSNASLSVQVTAPSETIQQSLTQSQCVTVDLGSNANIQIGCGGTSINASGGVYGSLSVSITIPSNAPSGQYWLMFDTSFYTPDGKWIESDVQYLNIGVNTQPTAQTTTALTVPAAPPPSNVPPDFIFSYWVVPNSLQWNPNSPSGFETEVVIWNGGSTGNMVTAACLVYAPNGGSVWVALYNVNGTLTWNGQPVCLSNTTNNVQYYTAINTYVEIAPGSFPPLPTGTYVLLFALGYENQNGTVTWTDERLVYINVGTVELPALGVLNNLINEALSSISPVDPPTAVGTIASQYAEMPSLNHASRAALKTIATASRTNPSFRQRLTRLVQMHEVNELVSLLHGYSYLTLAGIYARDTYNTTQNLLSTASSANNPQLTTSLQNAQSSASNIMSSLGITPNSTDDEISQKVALLTPDQVSAKVQATAGDVASINANLATAFGTSIGIPVVYEGLSDLLGSGALSSTSMLANIAYLAVLAGETVAGAVANYDPGFCNYLAQHMGVVSFSDFSNVVVESILPNYIKYTAKESIVDSNTVLSDIQLDINTLGFVELAGLAFFPKYYSKVLKKVAAGLGQLALAILPAYVPVVTPTPSSCVVPFEAKIHGTTNTLLDTWGSVLVSEDEIEEYASGSLTVPTLQIAVQAPQIMVPSSTASSTQVATSAMVASAQQIVALSSTGTSSSGTQYVLVSDPNQWLITDVSVYISSDCSEPALMSFTCAPTHITANGGQIICTPTSLYASTDIKMGQSYNLCLKFTLQIPMTQQASGAPSPVQTQYSLGQAEITVYGANPYVSPGITTLGGFTVSPVTVAATTGTGTSTSVTTPPSGNIASVRYYVTATLTGLPQSASLYMDSVAGGPQGQTQLYMLQNNVVQQPQVTISFSPTGNQVPSSCPGETYTDENGNNYCLIRSSAIMLGSITIQPGALLPSASYWTTSCPTASTLPQSMGIVPLAQNTLYICGVYQCTNTSNNTCPAVAVQFANIGFNGTIKYQVVATNINQLPASCGVQSPSTVTVQTSTGAVTGYVVYENTITMPGVPYSAGATFGQVPSAFAQFTAIPVQCLPDLVNMGANIYLVMYDNFGNTVYLQVPLVASKPLINVTCGGTQGQSGININVGGAIVIGTKFRVLVTIDVFEQDLGNAPTQTSIVAGVTFPNGSTYDATQYCTYYASSQSPTPCSSPIQLVPGTMLQYVVEIDILPVLQANPSLYQYMTVNSQLQVSLNFVGPSSQSIATCTTPAYVGPCAASVLGYQTYIPITVCPIKWHHPVCTVQSGSMGGVPVLSPGQNATVVCYLTDAEFPTDVALVAVPLPTVTSITNYSYSELNDMALQYATSGKAFTVKIPADTEEQDVKVASFTITAMTTPGTYYVPVAFVVMPTQVTASATALRSLSSAVTPTTPSASTNAYLLDLAYAYYTVSSSPTGACPASGQIHISPASESYTTSPGQTVNISYYVYNDSPYDLTLQCSYVNPFTQNTVNIGQIPLQSSGNANVQFTLDIPTNAQPGTYNLTVTCGMYNGTTSCGNTPNFTATISVQTQLTTQITANCNFTGGLTNIQPNCQTTLSCTVTNNSPQSVTVYLAIYDSLGNQVTVSQPASIQPNQQQQVSVSFTTPNAVGTFTYVAAIFTATPPMSLSACSPTQQMPYCTSFMVATSTSGTCPSVVTTQAAPTQVTPETQLLNALLSMTIFAVFAGLLIALIRSMRSQQPL